MWFVRFLKKKNYFVIIMNINFQIMQELFLSLMGDWVFLFSLWLLSKYHSIWRVQPVTLIGTFHQFYFMFLWANILAYRIWRWITFTNVYIYHEYNLFDLSAVFMGNSYIRVTLTYYSHQKDLSALCLIEHLERYLEQWNNIVDPFAIVAFINSQIRNRNRS